MLPRADGLETGGDDPWCPITPNVENHMASKIQKLELNRETLRRLTEDETKQVLGAAATKTCPCTHTSAGPSHPIFC